MVLISFDFVWSAPDPNWPIKLRPGNTAPVSASNASAYRFAGYCVSGGGDVAITFGGATFSAPCHPVLGVYKYDGDVSSETVVNPIKQCVVQGASPSLCAKPVTNELAPPGMVFTPDPLRKIAPNNETDYRLSGDCAPAGASITIDIGLETNILSGVCLANNRFNLAGNVSAVLDGLGIPVLGSIDDGGAVTTETSTVVKGVKVEISSAPNIDASNYLSYDISGTCSDEGRDILLNIGGYIPSPLPVCSSSLWALTGLDVSSVSEGAVIITADHNDVLGNSAVQFVSNIEKDTILPDVLSWAWNLTPVSGSSSTDETPVLSTSFAEDTVSLQLYDDAMCLSAKGASQTVLLGAANFADIAYTPVVEDGLKPFYVIAVDSIGNTTSCIDLSLNYFLDSVVPDAILNFDFDSLWTTSAVNAPQVQWDGLTDPAPSSGLMEVEVGYTVNAGGGSEVSSGYESLLTSAVAHTFTSGSSFAECVNHYAELNVRDDAGNEATGVTPVPFRYDGTAPSFVGLPYVYDFAKADRAVGVNWSGISLVDSCSGLDEIQISIGTSSGLEDVVSYSTLPIDVNLDTSYKVVDGVDGFSLSLDLGSLYYTNLKFIDVAGNESTVSVGPWRIPIFKVSTSAESTCGVDTADSVKCWGRAYQGSMGYGNNTRTSVAPAMVDGMDTGWDQVGSAVRYSCALSSAGGVKCWGQGDYGQLGDGSIDDNYTPNDVTGLTSGVKNLGVGFRHACAVLDSGSIKCWGQNNYRQLGNGLTVNSPDPVDVAGITNAVQVTSGAYYSCALLDTAEIKCWGRGNYGQMGNGSTATQSVPVLVSGINNATYITAGLYHACATLLGGEVKCWGRGTNGRLGNGGTARATTPVFVTGLTNIIEVEAYSGSTCAIDFVGGVKCWGQNADYQVGDGTNVDKTTPVDPVGLSSGNLSLSQGDWALHTCVMTTARKLKCWGRSNYYQTGASNLTADVQVPGDVRTLTNKILKIDAGQNFTCALEDDGTGLSGGLRCWGAGSYGRQGNGSTSNSYPLALVPGLESGVKDFSVGYYHACALVDDGAGAGGVKCWGRNNQGQVGTGNTVDQTSPVDVAGLTSGVESLSVHLFHGCAVTTGGALYCWGRNNQGQLGIGNRTNSFLPTLVPGMGAGVESVSTGRYHTCAVMTSGALYCWGDNVRGQIGDGTQSDRLSPVLISASGIESVSAGYRHTCAVTDSGALDCWGENLLGEVGDGTVTRRRSPVAVSGMSSGVMSVSAGFRYTCASMDDGGMFCWGDSGTYGRLGDGTSTDSLVPNEIINYTGDVSQIATGLLTNGQTCMLQTDGDAYCWGYYGGYNHGWGSYWTTDTVNYKAPFKRVSRFLAD